MTVHDEQKKRQALNDLIYALAKDQEALREKEHRKDCFLNLEKIYYEADDNNFRHFYSDIYGCLTIIDGDPQNGNIDILAENMEIIKSGYRPNINKDGKGNPIDVSKEIIKLYDHINLDIGRLNYTKRINENTTADLAKTTSLIQKLEDKIENVDEKLKKSESNFKEEAVKLSEEIKNSQKNMQNEYITILGIFAAIVLAFTGGMTFTSSVLENLHKSSIYRIIFVALIIGCIVYNLLWLLIDFIRNVNGNTIRKSWMFWAFNTMFILMMLGTGFAYKYDWMAREEAANKQIQIEQYMEDASINVLVSII